MSDTTIERRVENHSVVLGFLIVGVGVLSVAVAGLVVAMLFVWRALP